MKALVVVLIYFLTSCVFVQQNNNLPALQSVDHVDLSRYIGLWYEIGRYPNSFQKDCLSTSALYTARSDGGIDVLNSCTSKKSGRLKEAKGRAWVVGGSGNSRLKVSFFWPFKGDYWIIDLGDEYEYAVVGTPDRKYLWILSRSQQLEPVLLDQILVKVEQHGFIPAKIIMQ